MQDTMRYIYSNETRYHAKRATKNEFENLNYRKYHGKDDEMNAQLKKGNLDLCVLALLCENDMYGFELVGRISEAVQISEGTIYPLLKRIKDVGYVTTYLSESPGGPPRKYYSITGEGRAEKDRLLAEWREFIGGINKIVGIR